MDPKVLTTLTYPSYDMHLSQRNHVQCRPRYRSSWLENDKGTLDLGDIPLSVVCSQVPHWMNLSFAQAPHREPHGSVYYDGRHDGGPNSRPTVPAGLAGAVPVRDDYVAGFDELPIPKLVDPPVFRLNPDGSINMASISLPPVLAALLGLNRDRDEENEGQGGRCRRGETEEREEPSLDGKECSNGSSDSPEEQSEDGPSESRERQSLKGSSGTSVSQEQSKNRSSSSQTSENQYRTPPQSRERDSDDKYNDDGNDKDNGDESERQLKTIPTEKTYEWGNVERVWPQPAPGIRGLMAAGPNTSSAIKNSSPSSVESAAGTTTASGGGGGGGITCMSTASTTPPLILARHGARLPAPTACQGGSAVGGGNSSGGSGGSSGSSGGGGGGGGGSSGGMVPTPPMPYVLQRLKSSHPSASANASNRPPEV